MFEFFLNERSDSHWLSRRHEGVARPLEEISMLSAGGISFLVPEIQLFFKAKYLRSKDQADFANSLPRMNRQQRAWLLDRLLNFHPLVPWIQDLQMDC